LIKSYKYGGEVKIEDYDFIDLNKLPFCPICGKKMILKEDQYMCKSGFKMSRKLVKKGMDILKKLKEAEKAIKKSQRDINKKDVEGIMKEIGPELRAYRKFIVSEVSK